MSVQIIDTHKLWSDRFAKKTKGMKCVSVKDTISSEIVQFLMIKTPEGVGPIKEDGVFCVGPGGDIWIQTQAQINKKYNLTGKDEKGDCKERKAADTLDHLLAHYF